MAIPVKLPVFEGPLDLLMHLIEKNKIDIYDIPISEITDQYLDYVRQMDREDMDVTSEFLVMAATLLDIKSRMLLPREKDEETGEEEGDPREELVRRLLEYKKYRYLSEELAVRREQAGVRFFREQHLPKEVRSYQPPIDYGELLGNVDLASLEKVFGEVLRRKKSRRDPIRSGFGKIRRDEVNIDNKALYIRAFLKTHPHTDFRALLESQESREEVIVTFLILLELMKNQKVHIVQDSIGGRILVEASETAHAEVLPEEPGSPEAEPVEPQDESSGPDETPSMDTPVEATGSAEAEPVETPPEESDLSAAASPDTTLEGPGSAAAESADKSADTLFADTYTEAAPMEETSGSFRNMQSAHTTGVALSALRRVEVTAPLPPASEEEIPFPIPAVTEADAPIPPAAPQEDTLRTAAASENEGTCTEYPEEAEDTCAEYPEEAEDTCTGFPEEAEDTCTGFPEEAEGTCTEYPEAEDRSDSGAEEYAHFSDHLWHGRSPCCEVVASFSGIHSTGPCGAQRRSSPCRSLWERNRLSRLWARCRY
ncbi:MAG: hypothetical protein E7237_07750 [Sarcina sp.]|nr:hypothetical protein [Sarcina sp.]